MAYSDPFKNIVLRAYSLGFDDCFNSIDRKLPKPTNNEQTEVLLAYINGGFDSV